MLSHSPISQTSSFLVEHYPSCKISLGESNSPILWIPYCSPLGSLNLAESQLPGLRYGCLGRFSGGLWLNCVAFECRSFCPLSHETDWFLLLIWNLVLYSVLPVSPPSLLLITLLCQGQCRSRDRILEEGHSPQLPPSLLGISPSPSSWQPWMLRSGT